MGLFYFILLLQILCTGFGFNSTQIDIEDNVHHQLKYSQLNLRDKFPVPPIIAMYSYDQNVVRILLNFIIVPENSVVLSLKHQELIKNYIYEWTANIQEPLDKKKEFKWHGNLSYFYSYIPKSLSFPDIILRIVIRVQQDLVNILNFSEDLLWKEKVVERVYEAEAMSGIDSLQPWERESAALSLASLCMTYNLHPFELFSSDTINAKSTNLITTSFASAAVFSLQKKYFTISLEWANAAIRLLSGELNEVWNEVHNQNENLKKKFISDEVFWEKLQHFRQIYERSKIIYNASELMKLNGYLNFEKPHGTKIYENLKLKYWKERSDLHYFKICYNVISILHDSHWNTSSYENYLTLFPNLISQENCTIQSNKEVKEKHILEYKAKSETYEIKVSQDKLCRGIESKTSKELSQLFCRKDSRNSSYLVLMPAKVEVLNKDPEILIFHDIVGEKIEELHQLNLPIARRTLKGAGNGHSFYSFLNENNSEKVKGMNHFIGDLTGYIATQELSGIESFIMHSYYAGGFFLPHSDALGIFDEPFDSEDQERRDYLLKVYFYGDQQASFLIYMNDDMIGGRTVFPKLKLSVKPEKGSAILWTNLFLNGSLNDLTNHAGCPVLNGIKLVAVKWFRSSTQMLRKPCGLQKNM